MLRRLLPLLGALPLAVAAQAPVDSARFNDLHWRMIGPWRGGRVTAVAGHADQPHTFYFGGTGGGVWKTTDGGLTWWPMTDSTRMAGSVGAIAVAPSDPNVVYVGTGEAPPRGNVSPGNGMWRSTDGGKTWARDGLPDAGQIAAIQVHPRDENVVYAAVLGHIFGNNTTRGVYRSRDGGTTWQQVLAPRNDSTGTIDLVMDPTNPRVLYAAMWQVRRYPWDFESGGAGSGLFKSVDGGDTWTELTRHDGLPDGVVGKIGIAVSPANPDRIWAQVEAQEGGLFRSDNGGNTWRRVNDDRRLRQRAWYYTEVYADPADENTVYMLNTSMYRSVDGGETLESIRTPHGDNHDLWIAPNDPNRMVEGNDGGANVTYNGGGTWTGQDNQPTAQMYHAFATNEGPYYRVCGGQQDNTTICVPARTTGGSIGTSTYQILGGCESGYVAVRPDNPDISFAGCYGGAIDRQDRSIGQERAVTPWPLNPMGWGADSLVERFQWTFPIVLSPQNPNVLYATSQHVFKSTNGGQSWQRISDDLTRNDKAHQAPAGGPITKDNTSIEYYNTIFALAPSPRDSMVLWAGSDDGLVHVTRDGGATWTDVTPRDLPQDALISIIDASPHATGTAYVAATRYKLDDFTPYLYKTTDYGRSWRRITTGIPAGQFVRTIREDPVRQGLLYAAGEFGAYVSFDDGGHWQSLQLNLPIVPVHDLIVHGNDLVAATHGRGFWILDDISPLRQATQVTQAPAYLYRPDTALRLGGGGFGGFGGVGSSPNPPTGVVVDFVLHRPENDSTPVSLEFLQSDGTRIAHYATNAHERNERLRVHDGHNRFTWNMQYPGADRFEGLIMWAGRTSGPTAVPGTYQVKLSMGDTQLTAPITIVADPRVHVSQADLQAQFDFLIQIRDAVSAANNGVSRIRSVRKDIQAVLGQLPRGQGDSVRAMGRRIVDDMGAIERELYQTQNRSNQDPLNFPIRLNNQIAALMGVVGSADARPTDASHVVFTQLKARLDSLLGQLDTLVHDRIPAFNAAVAALNLPAVKVDN